MLFNKIFTDESLDKIKIQKIEVIERTNTINLHALSQEIIDFNHIENIKDEISKHYNNSVNVEIYLKYKLEKNINIEKIKENLLYIINKSSNILSKAKDNIKIEFKDECFFVIADNKLLIDELNDNNTERKLKKLICDYNLDYNIKAIYNEAEEEAAITAQRIFDQALKKNLEIIKNNSSEKKPANKSQEGSYKKRSRKKIDFDSIPVSLISELTNDSGVVNIKGKIVNVDKRELKNGSFLISLIITDSTDSIMCKYFCPNGFDDEGIENGNYIQIAGNVEYDDYEKELIVKILDLQLTTEEIKRMDNAKEKRVELHLHTGMSSMDGINSFKEYAKKARQWGHKAIAITDHGVVQGYPEAMDCADDNFKVIYGMEGYLVNDTVSIVQNCQNVNLDSVFVVFDIETTGLNPKNDNIIEIGAVKISNRKVIDSFSTFVHIDKKLPGKIIELTSITDDMLQGQPEIDEALPAFLDFAKECVLVAHNAKFDLGFIKENTKVLSIENYNPPVLDTLELSKALIKDVKNHRLNTLTKKLGINLINHHRAVDDANATGQLLIILLNKLSEREIYDVSKLNDILMEDIDIVKQPSYHINILVTNYIGLKNLYSLVSDSHINNFYKKPRLLKSNLNQLREGLLLGTACESGELFSAILEGKSDEKIEEIADYYDFYEIQPLDNNMFL
ncbi:MAG: PHP domain-containing protein, partial [Sedimentibacter sp.]|nr:PHP domain-containing protein [Sedimentibacter sp.]